jgi:hypothetical protein
MIAQKEALVSTGQRHHAPLLLFVSSLHFTWRESKCSRIRLPFSPYHGSASRCETRGSAALHHLLLQCSRPAGQPASQPMCVSQLAELPLLAGCVRLWHAVCETD